MEVVQQRILNKDKTGTGYNMESIDANSPRVVITVPKSDS